MEEFQPPLRRQITPSSRVRADRQLPRCEYIPRPPQARHIVTPPEDPVNTLMDRLAAVLASKAAAVQLRSGKGEKAVPTRMALPVGPLEFTATAGGARGAHVAGRKVRHRRREI